LQLSSREIDGVRSWFRLSAGGPGVANLPAKPAPPVVADQQAESDWLTEANGVDRQPLVLQLSRAGRHTDVYQHRKRQQHHQHDERSCRGW
jgi:hypothetical protein